MREAVGGGLLMYLIIPFLVIFIVFMAFIMKYASAYRAANYIVTQIESCQGYKDCKSKPQSSVVASVYYYKEKPIITCAQSDGNVSVYRVEMKVPFSLPLIGKFNAFSVKAETKSVRSTCTTGTDVTSDWLK